MNDALNDILGIVRDARRITQEGVGILRQGRRGANTVRDALTLDPARNEARTTQAEARTARSENRILAEAIRREQLLAQLERIQGVRVGVHPTSVPTHASPGWPAQQGSLVAATGVSQDPYYGMNLVNVQGLGDLSSLGYDAPGWAITRFFGITSRDEVQAYNEQFIATVTGTQVAATGVVPQVQPQVNAPQVQAQGAGQVIARYGDGVGRQGGSGPVVSLQTSLNLVGAGLPVDGDFGDGTRDALIAFLPTARQFGYNYNPTALTSQDVNAIQQITQAVAAARGSGQQVAVAPTAAQSFTGAGVPQSVQTAAAQAVQGTSFSFSYDHQAPVNDLHARLMARAAERG